MIQSFLPYSDRFEVHQKMMYFPCKVYSAVILDDRVIVGYSGDELEGKFPGSIDQTVWCYDLNGNLLWKIAKPYYINRDTGERITYDQPFHGVAYHEPTNEILAYSRRGYVLDPYTGELSNDFELR